MSWRTALLLGRVSNLPTVWTNGLAGMMIAGGSLEPGPTALLMASLSSFYVGGMYLNDAFDRDVDAVERPERPIPSGLVTARTVFVAGFGLLALALALLGLAASRAGQGRPDLALVSGTALAAAIVYYDANHKGSSIAPLWMGSCRALVYATAALCTAGRIDGAVVGCAICLLLYVAGLTYVAARENLREVRNLWPVAMLAAPLLYAAEWAWKSAPAGAALIALAAWTAYALSFLLREGERDIPGAVVRLIAGISLVDALFLASRGWPELAVVAVGGFALTRLLHRLVPGT